MVSSWSQLGIGRIAVVLGDGDRGLERREDGHARQREGVGDDPLLLVEREEPSLVTGGSRQQEVLAHVVLVDADVNEIRFGERQHRGIDVVGIVDEEVEAGFLVHLLPEVLSVAASEGEAEAIEQSGEEDRGPLVERAARRRCGRGTRGRVDVPVGVEDRHRFPQPLAGVEVVALDPDRRDVERRAGVGVDRRDRLFRQRGQVAGARPSRGRL